MSHFGGRMSVNALFHFETEDYRPESHYRSSNVWSRIMLPVTVTQILQENFDFIVLASNASDRWQDKLI